MSRFLNVITNQFYSKFKRFTFFLKNLVLFSSLLALNNCSKKEPEIVEVAPIIIGGSNSLSVLAESLLEEELVVHYPPEGSLSQSLLDQAEHSFILIPEGDSEVDQADWVQELLIKGAQTITISDTSALSPTQTLSSLTELTDALDEQGIITAAIMEQSEFLQSELEPLSQRWTKAVTPLPKEANLYTLNKDLKPFRDLLPSQLHVITAAELAEEATKARTKVTLVSKEPKQRVMKELTELKLTPILFHSTPPPSLSAMLEDLEENTTAMEQLSELIQKAFTKPLLEGYEKGMVELLENYCIECHDEINEEGGVNFELFLTESSAVKNPSFWEGVKAQVELGAMPPKKRDQLDSEEKEFFLAWIDSLSERWDSGEFGADPGRTTIRRLNKNEYNYTVRDLFGLKVRPADGFPEDSGGAAGFDNNADALFLPSLLMENYVEAAGKVVEAVYANNNARSRYLFNRPSTIKDEEKAARAILNRWLSLSFRRKATPEEIDNYTTIFTTARKKARTFGEAMKLPLVGILISPDFLYRSEIEQSGNEAYSISDFDLANRLSYFLWSSMPDPELLRLAAAGNLSSEEAIEEQVIRMLGDTKANSLPMHFAGQWFGWEELRSRANPDTERYPEFTFPLRVDLYKESTSFFQHLVKTNSSAYDLLNSDYAFLNEQVANHYGIPGVTGTEFRKVDLPDSTRGGVLGMGSVLVATSLPLRSSPAVRGDFILADILGTPPPDPPMNVEQLPADDQEIQSQSFREALEQHREDPNCYSCHQIIDPLGFGMEQFDAIGRWRTVHNGHEIDASGALPDGTSISSPADIRNHLMENKDLFTRNLVEKLLSYALGRELTAYDRPVIAEITKKVIEDDGKIHTAFIEVAKSYPFRHRRNDGYKPH